MKRKKPSSSGDCGRTVDQNSAIKDAKPFQRANSICAVQHHHDPRVGQVEPWQPLAGSQHHLSWLGRFAVGSNDNMGSSTRTAIPDAPLPRPVLAVRSNSRGHLLIFGKPLLAIFTSFMDLPVDPGSSSRRSDRRPVQVFPECVFGRSGQALVSTIQLWAMPRAACPRVKALSSRPRQLADCGRDIFRTGRVGARRAWARGWHFHRTCRPATPRAAGRARSSRHIVDCASTTFTPPQAATFAATAHYPPRSRSTPPWRRRRSPG
jgi:hypothetical protein